MCSCNPLIAVLTPFQGTKRKMSESSESSDEETTSLRQKNAVIVQLRKRLREEKEYSRRLGLALLDKIRMLL